MEKNFHYVYKITHVPSGHYYIGRRSWYSIDDKYIGSGSRWSKEFLDVYPYEEFTKEILWHGPSELLQKKEDHFIIENEGPLMVNLKRLGPGGVIRHHKSTLDLISKASNKQFESQEARDYVGKKTKEWIEENPEAFKLRTKKATATQQTSEWISKQSEILKKVCGTPEARKNNSESRKKWIKENPEKVAEINAKKKATMNTPESFAKRSASAKRWQRENPEDAKAAQAKSRKTCGTPEARENNRKRNKQWRKDNPEAARERQERANATNGTPEARKANGDRIRKFFQNNPHPSRTRIEVLYDDGRKEVYPSMTHVPGVPQSTISQIHAGIVKVSKKYGIVGVRKIPKT